MVVLLDKLLGPADTVPLERRLLSFVCLAMASFATLMGLVALTTDGGSILLSSLGALLYAATWLASRRGASQVVLVWVLLLMSFAILLGEWLWVSGPYGATIPGLVLMGAMLPVLALSARSWPVVVGAGVAGIVAFGVAIGLPLPHAATEPTRMLLIERGIQVSFWSLGALVLMGQVVFAYHRQERQLSAVNDELRKANRALDERNYELEVAARELGALREDYSTSHRHGSDLDGMRTLDD